MNKRTLRELFLFGIAGTAAYLVDAIITALLVPFLGVFAARIPAFIFSVTTTWIINRSWTFKSRKSHYSSLWKEYIHYFSLMIGGLVINYTTYIISALLLPESSYRIYLAVAFGCIAGMVINYLFSRRFIYNKSRDE